MGQREKCCWALGGRGAQREAGGLLCSLGTKPEAILKEAVGGGRGLGDGGSETGSGHRTGGLCHVPVASWDLQGAAVTLLGHGVGEEGLAPGSGRRRGLQREEWTMGGERRTLVGCLPAAWTREPAPRELA